MFVAHYALGLAARTATRKLPLPLLLLAATWADLIWTALMLAGVERANIVPGITAVSPWEMAYNPFSHGLAATLLWAVFFGLAGWRWSGEKRSGWILAGLVVSHWVLDLVTHRPDLPLLLDGPKVGLGLWNHRAASVLLEGGIFVAALGWHLWSTRARAWWAHPVLWLFAALLVAMWLPGALGFGPLPQLSVQGLATMLVFSLVLLLWAALIDRGSRPGVEAAKALHSASEARVSGPSNELPSRSR